MNVLKQQLAWVQQQLSQLTASQKMLAGALATLMFVTIVYWGKYASNADTVAVTDAGFAPERLGVIKALLERQNIPATIGSDGRIQVPADQQLHAYAAMAYGKMLPANGSAAVDKIVGQMTLWDSAAKTDKLWTEKRQIVMGLMMSKWPEVEEGEVTLAVPDHRSLTLPTEPRASVNLTLKDGAKPTKALAMTAAEFVVGNQVGLSRGNVRVVINGQVIRLADEDAGGLGSGSDILEQQQGWDHWYTSKIERALIGFPSPIVTVSVNLDLKRLSSTLTKIDPANSAPSSTSNTEKTSQNTTPAAPAEPGATPNTGAAIGTGAPGAASDANSTRETTETTALRVGEEVITTAQPAGNGTATTAAVQIPYSYFVTVWKKLNPRATAEPEEPSLLPIMTSEFEKIRSMVMSSTAIKDPKMVAVNAYYDPAPEPLALKTSNAGQVMGVVSGYGKEIGLSALALVSLLMVSGIVRKGAAPIPAINADALAAQKRELENMLNGGMGIATPSRIGDGVSSADEGDTALEAIELDDATNQTQQMVAQVTNLVKENPDGAVNLVKRWLNRD